MFTRMVVATARAAPVEGLITKTRPGRSLAHRFVAGDTLEEAVGVARRLNDQGFLVSLDLLGEEVHDRDSSLQARDGYLECLDVIEGRHLDANISVKLTQLGLAIDEAMAVEALDMLAARAGAVGCTITIDMEDSHYTEATVSIYEKVQSGHGNLGIALQAYLHRTPQDLERLIPMGGHIRLCKGAYVEPAEIAYTDKEEVDRAFARLQERLFAAESVRPAVATHDTGLISLARRLAADRRSSFEFQMLYGVRPALQRELMGQGFPLRVYLPFGSQWYPYLTRRLAERPANAWFLVRALFGS